MDVSIDNEELRREYEERGWFRMRPRGRKLYRPNLYRQLVRDWVCGELACPRCGAHALERRDGHRLVRGAHARSDYANYECAECGAQFYLIASYISHRGEARSRLYRGIVERIEEGTVPDLVCLTVNHDTFEVTDLFVLTGGRLRADCLRPGTYIQDGIICEELPEDQDIWCDILVGKLNHELGGNAIVDIVHGGEQHSPSWVVRALHAADDLGRRQ